MVQLFSPKARALCRLIAWLCALFALAAGVRFGTFVTADTDPYGYVSEAELFARGELRVDQRFALSMPWRNAEASFTPAGYKRATVEGFIVPTYPPGLPMTMAVLLRATGDRAAVFYVVPILGAVLVLATARLGQRVGGDVVGALSALLLVTSPTFLHQVMQPVSDVPAAAWWTVCLVMTLGETRWSAVGAGAAAAMAIATRPNLLPLAVVIGLIYAVPLLRATRHDRPQHLARGVLFAVALLPGGVLVAVLNDYWYGSPLSSGYAPFGELYAWGNVLPNLDRYPRWLVETQTPFILLAFLAPWVLRGQKHVSMLVAVVLVVTASYIPYGIFPREQWGYLRFLLPAWPPLLVLSMAVVVQSIRRLAPARPRQVIAILVVVLLWAGWQTRESIVRGAFRLRPIEQRYADVGRHVSGMPDNAVFIGALHAGSIRYYSGRLTMNYNGIHPRELEQVVTALDRMGRHAYFVLEQDEEPHFRWVFDYYTTLGRLDWPPAVESTLGPKVRIYDPDDRARFLAGQPITTYDLNHVSNKPIVTQR